MRTYKQYFKENYIKFIDPDTGKEVKRRVSDTFINSILKKKSDKFDSASYLKKIRDHGVKTGAFDKGENIDSRDVVAFFDFIKEAVPRNQLHNFLKELPRKDLQARFKEELSRSKKFSFLDVLDTTCDPSCKFADALASNPVVLKIRPASDRYKTRGAAGPGEAFLAFMFSGRKPSGAGDLELDDMIVELKANGGRIAKDLDFRGQGRLLRSFYPGIKSTTQEALPLILRHFNQSETNLSMLDFLSAVSGVPSGLDNLDIKYFAKRPISDLKKYPTYRELIQLLGPIQMKNYFTKIADFNTIAIFDNDIIIGFSRDILQRKTSVQIQKEFANSGVIIGAKPAGGSAYDASGFTINV